MKNLKFFAGKSGEGKTRKRKEKRKKNKKDGVIKVKEVLNKYLAIDKVEDGDKDLKSLVDKKTTLETIKRKVDSLVEQPTVAN